MGWFKRRKNKKESIENIKPKASYDLYNNRETQDINTQNNILVAYEEIKSDESSTNEMKTNIQKKDDEKMKTSNSSVGRTKTTTIKKEQSSGRNIYYVSMRKDDNGKKLGWEVKKEKAAKITKLCETKEEAIALVKQLAGNQGSTCIIRKMDGSIQETLKFKDKD